MWGRGGGGNTRGYTGKNIRTIREGVLKLSPENDSEKKKPLETVDSDSVLRIITIASYHVTFYLLLVFTFNSIWHWHLTLAFAFGNGFKNFAFAIRMSLPAFRRCIYECERWRARRVQSAYWWAQGCTYF